MGFLDSLSSLFGGASGAAAPGGLLASLGGGVNNFIHGATPVMAQQPGATMSAGLTNPVQSAETPASLQLAPQTDPGAIHTMPSFTPTGQTTGGLLSKLQDPDSRGLTFGDRLFAAGQALGGDSGGAATYLQNQRKMAQEEDDRMTAKRNAIAGAQALRDNYGPEGFNARGYMQAMGENLDPATLLALKKGVGRNFTSVSTSNGGVAAFDPDAGTARQVIAGTPKAPGPLILKPGTDANNPQNWVPNPNYMAATQEKSAAERAGKPLAPRVGRAPPKPGVPRPVATGRVF